MEWQEAQIGFSVHISPLGSQGFQNGRIHGECMNKTRLSFIPLFRMHGSRYHDTSKIQMAKYTNTKYLFFFALI